MWHRIDVTRQLAMILRPLQDFSFLALFSLTPRTGNNRECYDISSGAFKIILEERFSSTQNRTRQTLVTEWGGQAECGQGQGKHHQTSVRCARRRERTTIGFATHTHFFRGFPLMHVDSFHLISLAFLRSFSFVSFASLKTQTHRFVYLLALLSFFLSFLFFR